MLTKHKFQSQKADGTDVTLVKPSNWNDDHDVTTSTDGVALGRAAGAGPGPVQELPLSALMPTGLMMMWPGDAAPAGWMICSGQSLSTATYPGLFAVIGYAYGGAGGAFNLPDFRGRVAAGVDGGAGRLTSNSIGGRGPNAVGGVGGVEMNATYVPMTVSGTLYGSTSGQQSFRVYGTTDSGNQTQYGGVVGSGDVAHNYHQHWYDGNYVTDGNALSVAVGGSLSGGSNSYQFTVTQPTLMINYIIKAG